ncbi:hypothetical protein GIB67_033761, partial [Kingdonia uniflora]
MVIEPSNCRFQLLMDHINEIESYNGGDQEYLNEIFTWWHRIPKHMNFLKHFCYEFLQSQFRSLLVGVRICTEFGMTKKSYDSLQKISWLFKQTT